MKKKNILILGIIVITLGVLILASTVFKSNNKIALSQEPVFELLFENENTEEIVTIISKNEVSGIDYNICTYGGNIKIKTNNRILNLREAILNNEITLLDIINKIESEMEPEEIETYQDGGTKVYKYENYCIIKFNTLSGNKDLYFSKINFSYNELNNKKS